MHKYWGKNLNNIIIVISAISPTPYIKLYLYLCMCVNMLQHMLLYQCAYLHNEHYHFETSMLCRGSKKVCSTMDRQRLVSHPAAMTQKRATGLL